MIVLPFLNILTADNSRGDLPEMNPVLFAPLHFFPEERCSTTAMTQTVHRTVSILSVSGLLRSGILPEAEEFRSSEARIGHLSPGKIAEPQTAGTDRLNF